MSQPPLDGSLAPNDHDHHHDHDHDHNELYLDASIMDWSQYDYTHTVQSTNGVDGGGGGGGDGGDDDNAGQGGHDKNGNGDDENDTTMMMHGHHLLPGVTSNHVERASSSAAVPAVPAVPAVTAEAGHAQFIYHPHVSHMTRSGSTASSTAFSASNDDQDEEDDDDDDGDDEKPSGTYDLPLLPPPTTDSTLSMGLTSDWHSFAPSTVQTDPTAVAVAVFPINYAFPAVVSDQHPQHPQHQHPHQQHVVIDPSARGHVPVGAQNRVEERMTRSEGMMAVGGGGGGAGGWYGLDAVASVAAAMEDDNDDHDDHDKTPGTMMQVSSPAWLSSNSQRRIEVPTIQTHRPQSPQPPPPSFTTTIHALQPIAYYPTTNQLTHMVSTAKVRRSSSDAAAAAAAAAFGPHLVGDGSDSGMTRTRATAMATHLPTVPMDTAEWAAAEPRSHEREQQKVARPCLGRSTSCSVLHHVGTAGHLEHVVGGGAGDGPPQNSNHLAAADGIEEGGPGESHATDEDEAMGIKDEVGGGGGVGDDETKTDGDRPSEQMVTSASSRKKGSTISFLPILSQ
jgi:hypothetical protein